MASLEELRSERLAKLAALQKDGQGGYPSRSERTHRIGDIKKDFAAHDGEQVTLAGRVFALRKHGKAVFADIDDGSGRIQVLLNEGDMSPEVFALFDTTVDMGDIVEVAGVLGISRRGEETLNAASWRMLAKALRPLPDDWHGLQNEEERLRKRYLDMLTRPELHDMVIKRAKFWSAVRRFHEQHGFIEVQTPVLEITTGGGDANPFKTHHDALDQDVFLRISAGELWQKRLMVAGFEKTFEIGRIFRNEGMSPEHAQDYEQCEAYWAYADWRQMAQFLKECYQFVVKETFGTSRLSIRGFDIDFDGEWPEIDYATEIQRQTGIDIWSATEDDLVSKLKELGVVHEKTNRPRLIDALWKYCRKNIAGPAILVNELRELSPLAKVSPENDQVVERFHFIIAGSEVGQGYSELNDPIDQAERFEKQQALRDAGDAEAQMADMEFVEALEYGMPPTAGHGFSERLFAFLIDKPIREGQLFPLVKPK